VRNAIDFLKSGAGFLRENATAFTRILFRKLLVGKTKMPRLVLVDWTGALERAKASKNTGGGRGLEKRRDARQSERAGGISQGAPKKAPRPDRGSAAGLRLGRGPPPGEIVMKMTRRLHTLRFLAAFSRWRRWQAILNATLLRISGARASRKICSKKAHARGRWALVGRVSFTVMSAPFFSSLNGERVRTVRGKPRGFLAGGSAFTNAGSSGRNKQLLRNSNLRVRRKRNVS